MLIQQTCQQSQPFEKSHLVTEKGVVKAPVDMFIKWKPGMRRQFPEFTERGDRFEKNDVNKMLVYLVRYYIKTYKDWNLAIIRDNRIPPGNFEHHILKFVRKDNVPFIEWNRLDEYPFVAQAIAIPNWLKKSL